MRGQGTRLISLALKNAQNALERDNGPSPTEKALQRVAAKLRLAEPPFVIEGYDISNIAGADPVGVKVSFRDGRPDKAFYRKFKMKGFEDQDDPGMIRQTISRRVDHMDTDPLPDLFLIDGGKSQLNAAVGALKEKVGEPFPLVAAIAKARKEGELDRIFLPNRKNPVNFPKGDPGLMLLMRVRDESHRFVNTFLSKLRGKAVIRSSLDDVPGIGPKKRDALLKAFGSLKDILAAPDEDVLSVQGICEKDVESIRTHFDNRRDQSSTTESEAPGGNIFPH